jgi:hypothetical protein
MKPMTQIRLELDINAQKMLQQVQIHNMRLEDSIKAGIERALNEIFEDDNFEETIAELVKDEIQMTVKRACGDWTLRHKIHDTISKSIEGKIDEVANGWAEKIVKNLGE